jgi:hypothetical protein
MIDESESGEFLSKSLLFIITQRTYSSVIFLVGVFLEHAVLLDIRYLWKVL